MFQKNKTIGNAKCTARFKKIRSIPVFIVQLKKWAGKRNEQKSTFVIGPPCKRLKANTTLQMYFPDLSPHRFSDHKR